MNEPQIQKNGYGCKTLINSLGLISIGGILVVILAYGFGIARFGDRFFSNLISGFTPTQSAPQIDVRSIVINQIRNASELTTTIFVMEAVVPTKQDVTIGNLVVGTTKLLYIAQGEVRAGVNLSEIEPKNIEVSDNSITIQLPPPQILDSKIDVNRSTIYDYNRGFLELGPDTGPSLQALAQQEALKKIVTTACRQGILDRANERAKQVISQLVSVTGHKQVNITLQPSSIKSCGTQN